MHAVDVPSAHAHKSPHDVSMPPAAAAATAVEHESIAHQLQGAHIAPGAVVFGANKAAAPAEAGSSSKAKTNAAGASTKTGSNATKDDKKGRDGKAKKRNRVYLETAIPPSKGLPDIAIGAIELNTFFPRHSRWPAYYVRLFRHGWRVNDMTKAQLHARGNLDKANFDALSAAMRYQVVNAIGALYPGQTPTAWLASGHADAQPFGPPANGTHIDLYNISTTTPAFTPPGQITVDGDATLAEVVHGVVNWPQGEDRGCLTLTLAWAQAQPGNYMDQHTTADLATIMPILLAQGTITSPNEANSTSTWDQSALSRLRANIATP